MGGRLIHEFDLYTSKYGSACLITSELANQRTQKVLFTCVVYTNNNYTNHHQHHHNHNDDLITVLSVFPLKGGSSSEIYIKGKSYILSDICLLYG